MSPGEEQHTLSGWPSTISEDTTPDFSVGEHAINTDTNYHVLTVWS